MGSSSEVWQSVKRRLRARLGDELFNNWLLDLNFCQIDSGRCTLEAPSQFVKDWIEAHFKDDLVHVFTEEGAAVQEVILTAARSAVQKDLQVSALVSAEVKKSKASDHLGTSVNAELTFDSFVVGKPNEFAYAAAKRVAEGSDITFNPLFLHGSVGLGKTHLMNAIANQKKALNPESVVVYLSAEKFMYHFIRALRLKDMVNFKDQLRSADMLLIDDIQFIADKESTQEEFFHTFNALVDQKRQVVLSADKSPSDLKGIEERVRSRLAWGLVADIHPTTYELRLGILQAKAEGHDIPASVLEFLAQKITSNVRELEGALTRLIAHKKLMGGDMSLSFAQDVLRDVLKACDKTVTIESIQRYVANYYNVRQDRLGSIMRTKEISYPRQMGMFLSKKMTGASLKSIARSFGKKDHTTVLYAVKKIQSLAETDAQVSEDIDLLGRMLQG